MKEKNESFFALFFHFRNTRKFNGAIIYHKYILLALILIKHINVMDKQLGGK